MIAALVVSAIIAAQIVLGARLIQATRSLARLSEEQPGQTGWSRVDDATLVDKATGPIQHLPALHKRALNRIDAMMRLYAWPR